MSEIAPVYQHPALTLEQVIVGGDLAALKPEERLEYYNNVCKSVGLNPLTRPLEYIKLNGKLTLYARKDCADQLRKINGVNCEILDRRITEGVAVVHVKATDKTGRHDEDIGVVAAANLRGDALANALMKAVTKAKRRVTLSICGLGWLDESEIESIPDAEHVDIDDKPEPPKVITAEQVKRLKTMCTQLGVDDGKIKTTLEIGSFNDITDQGAAELAILTEGEADLLQIMAEAENVEQLQEATKKQISWYAEGSRVRRAFAKRIRQLENIGNDKD